MRGEFIGVWSETWREIWLPLIDHEGVPEDLFCASACYPTAATVGEPFPAFVPAPLPSDPYPRLAAISLQMWSIAP